MLLSNYRHGHYTPGRYFTNIYLMILNGAIDLLFRAVYLVILDYFYRHIIISFSNVVVYWVLLIILEDFLYYWLHRFDHEIRLFWAVHVTHHSSEYLNFTVGFRSSVFQPLYRFFYFIPLALLGFSPIDIAFIYSATQIWGILVHTKLIRKMGWLEYFLVTPSHHRVHHASNPKYLDKNMGMFLIIWDKMFGTFQAELAESEYEPIRYGLTKPVEKVNIGTIIFHEWQSIWGDIEEKILMARTYSSFLGLRLEYDGSRQTSEEMRQQEAGLTWCLKINRQTSGFGAAGYGKF